MAAMNLGSMVEASKPYDVIQPPRRRRAAGFRRQASPYVAARSGRDIMMVEVFMIQTVEAVVDETGRVRLLGEVQVDAPRRALVMVLDEPAAIPGEAALLAEAALAADWSRPEEDAAWSHLQSAK